VVAGFNSTTRANTRLLQLTQAGYLVHTFIGSISGGRKAVYRLSNTTRSTIANQVARAAKSARSELFVEPQLAVNSIYAVVKHKPIPIIGCQFHQWISFNQPLSKTCPLIPDGYFELQQQSAIKSFFIEVDLGSEALRIWQKKIEGYLKLASSAEFSRIFAQNRFKVCVIAHSERRAENIRRLIAKFTDKIFRFTSFEFINRQGVWSAIWRKP